MESTDKLTIDSLTVIKAEVRRSVRAWINAPTISTGANEGFYALHYASFHGNSKLIKMLVKNGADPFAKNKSGINMLHVAAQGDEAYSLTYFKTQGISINSRDSEGSTPLHWACYAASDTACYYLNYWGCEVNA